MQSFNKWVLCWCNECMNVCQTTFQSVSCLWLSAVMSLTCVSRLQTPITHHSSTDSENPAYTVGSHQQTSEMWQVWGQHSERGLSGWYVTRRLSFCVYFLMCGHLAVLCYCSLVHLGHPPSRLFVCLSQPCSLYLRRSEVAAASNTGSHYWFLTCPWTQCLWTPTPVTLLIPAAGEPVIRGKNWGLCFKWLWRRHFS